MNKSECPGIVCLRWNKSDILGNTNFNDKKIVDILERVENLDEISFFNQKYFCFFKSQPLLDIKNWTVQQHFLKIDKRLVILIPTNIKFRFLSHF